MENHEANEVPIIAVDNCSILDVVVQSRLADDQLEVEELAVEDDGSSFHDLHKKMEE